MDLAVDQTSSLLRGLKSLRLSELGLRPVQQLSGQASRVSRWRCGRIVTESGRLVGVFGNWWPHFGSWLQVVWDMHLRAVRTDRCELFYYQPFACPNYLTLSYIHSGARTSLTTLYLATLALDEIARFRKADAIVCHATNDRITNRLMSRWGWEPHCLHWRGRHFIKRFYGKYPEIPSYWRTRLANDSGRHLLPPPAAQASFE